MNQVLEIIKKRRTTRSYKNEQIKDEELNQIIEAGLWAPSAHNMQSWHFTVVQNKDILEELNADAKEEGKNFRVEDIKRMLNNEKFHIFYNAPTVILVAYDKNALAPIQDISAASQNMLLAAESLGIGGCWNGIVSIPFRNEEIADKYSEKLGIPENYTVNHAVVLGYPKTEILRGPARKENNVIYVR